MPLTGLAYSGVSGRRWFGSQFLIWTEQSHVVCWPDLLADASDHSINRDWSADPNMSRNGKSGSGGVTTFVSRDIDVVSERLTSITGASTRIDYFGDPDAFSMSLTATKLGDLVLSKVQVAGWSLTRPMESLTNISIPIAGTPMKLRSGNRSYEVSARDAAAVGRPFEMLEAKFHQGAAIVLHAPIEALIERAEQLTNGSLSGSPISQMADRVDLSAPIGEALARTLKTAISEVSALDSSGLGSLVAAGYEELADQPCGCGSVSIHHARSRSTNFSVRLRGNSVRPGFYQGTCGRPGKAVEAGQ